LGRFRNLLAFLVLGQGRYAPELILARSRGKTPPPFHYIDRGTMATIGRSAAVVALGRWRYNGMLAWLTWFFVHLTFLIQFENKFLVLCQWAWNYFTRNRSARLITGPAEAAASAEKHTT
jgi:NADH dehydrogenase